MTSNEELCVRAKSGERAALRELWEQNRGLTRMKARQVLRALDAWGRGDVELSDLEQSAWFALERAARDFDPAAGFKFTTYYTKHLKTAFAEAAGSRTERQQRDPLNLSTSLDAPIGDDDSDGSTIGDIVPDPTDESGQVLERLQEDWERGVIRSQIDALPADQARVLRLRYWETRSVRETAAAMGVTTARARALERKALDALRRCREVRALRDYLDERTDFFRRGPDPVLDNVLWREELTERRAGHWKTS